MSWVFIEPTDVWLFRDGKPFDAGSDHRARTLFPPNPTTVQGAIRSKILAASGVSLTAFAQRNPSCRAVAEQIGWPGDPPPFRLRGPFVARCTRDPSGTIRQVTPYFPLPADVVRGTKDRQYRILAPLKEGHFRANWPQDGLLPLWARSTEVLTEVTGWLDQGTLLAYLNRASPSEQDVVRDEHLFARESRFGVGIDSRVKRPQEGLLYQIELARPRENIGLLVEIDDSHLSSRVKLPGDGLMSMGGESRGSRFTVLSGYNLPANPWPPPGADGKRLKLYFLTPAWFSGGWTATDWGNWLVRRNLRVVAAAIRRAQPIGGVRVDTESQKGNFQKTMHRYIPAGSVFYFEAGEPVMYNGEPVTDSVDEGRIGFGQVLIGTWDYA